MKKILLSNRYDSVPKQIVMEALPSNMELVMLENVTQEEFAEKACCVDYILASGRLKINRELLDGAIMLRMIQRTGVGLDSIDLDEVRKKGIPLYVNPGVNAESVAEHTILLILSCLRKLTVINSNTKKGVWKKQSQGVLTREISTQTVGIVGMGHIGRRVAELLKAFESRVLYYDVKRLTEEEEAGLGVTYTEIDDLLKSSDVITLHCPLTEGTRNIICEQSINKMKTGVAIVNTARGGLICEQDLIDGLNAGKVAFAGLDVFSEEPTSNNQLLAMPNVIATPHLGGITRDSFGRMMKNAMRNIELFDRGEFEMISQYKYV